MQNFKIEVKMKKHIYINGVLFLGILIVFTGCNKSSDDNSIKPVNVEIIQVKNTDGSHVLAYSGTIEESESIPLSFSTVGNVLRVLVSEGDFVKKGQLLAVLNNETYKNIYETALASQKQAEDAYKRL
jgi:multidrug efflux pump subunit AcrA (membrane-fusion protein)